MNENKEKIDDICYCFSYCNPSSHEVNEHFRDLPNGLISVSFMQWQPRRSV